MPEGERSFALSKGPRKKFSVEVSADTYLLLKVAGAGRGGSAHGQATDVLEKWAERFLEQNAARLRGSVANERERRAGV